MCLAAHLSEFLGWTPGNVKLLLPPRQSRGNSRCISQARELTQQDWVKYDFWGGTPEEHKAAVEEYQREINEIIASLPQRSESNRAETIKYLKALGFPNPFNQPSSH